MQSSAGMDQTGNLVLDALSPLGRERVFEQGHEVTIRGGERLFEANETMIHVYFPFSGVVSLMARMRQGSRVEAASVGREGMIGLPVLLNGRFPGNIEAVTRISGRALRLDAESFDLLVKTDDRMHELLHRSTQALLNQVMNAAACTMLHPFSDRLARWLLHTHDRIGGDEMPLTHDVLASMMGARRATVTAHIGALKDSGAITYRRGRVQILDRDALEGVSCECYPNVRDEYERLTLSPAEEAEGSS